VSALRRLRLVASLLLAVPAAGPALGDGLGLPELQALALKNNPAGVQAEAIRQLGRAEISVARVWSDPLVEGLLGRGKPLGSGPSAQESGFQISQELPSPIAYRHRIQAAEFGSAEREAQALARRLDLLFQVEVLYYELAAALEGVRLLGDNAEGAERVLALASQRVELGEARETERIRAEVESLRQERSLAAVRREADVTRGALLRVVGPGFPEGAEVEQAWPNARSTSDLETLRALMTGRNPELAGARARISQSAESTSAAAWGAWPDLKATYYDLREIDKKAQGAKLEIAVPLWNANRAETSRRRAEESILRADLKQQEITLGNDLERAFREFRLSAEQAEVFSKRLLPAAREGLRLAELSYGEGETSFLDLLDAQRTYREATAELVALHRDAARSLAMIHRLTGGANASEAR
jgi:cobalt-zinc-cadmium efflux system outer membrane protein